MNLLDWHALEVPRVLLLSASRDPHASFFVLACCWIAAAYFLLLGGRAGRIEARRRASLGAGAT